MSNSLAYRVENGALVPIRRYAEEFARVFSEGELYRMEEVHPRSLSSHRHYFACINEAFKNLPAPYSERFLNADHLRRWALIMAGYCEQNTIATASDKAAIAAAALVAELDEYAITEVSENIVTVYRAKSQSVKAMGAKEFQASKDATLNEISRLLNVDVETLKANAGAAA